MKTGITKKIAKVLSWFLLVTMVISSAAVSSWGYEADDQSGTEKYAEEQSYVEEQLYAEEQLCACAAEASELSEILPKENTSESGSAESGLAGQKDPVNEAVQGETPSEVNAQDQGGKTLKSTEEENAAEQSQTVLTKENTAEEKVQTEETTAASAEENIASEEKAEESAEKTVGTEGEAAEGSQAEGTGEAAEESQEENSGEAAEESQAEGTDEAAEESQKENSGEAAEESQAEGSGEAAEESQEEDSEEAADAEDDELSANLMEGEIAAPVLKGTELLVNGIKISWEEVEGADSYIVYRKTSGSEYTDIGTATETSFTDVAPVHGTYYTYTVAAKAGEDTGLMDEKGVSSIFVQAPVVTSVTAGSKGAVVKWDTIPYAAKYILYRKVGENGQYSKIKSTTKVSYTDTTVKTGERYYYAVVVSVSIGGKTYTSAISEDGTPFVSLATPAVSSLSNTSTGIQIKYSSVKGATGYIIYRKKSGGSWSKLKTTAETSWVDTSAAAGKAYYYTVKAYSNLSGVKFYSGYNKGGTGLFRVAPSNVKSVTNTTEGLKISWNASSNVTGYRIYRKTEGTTSWVKLANSTATSYVDKTAVQGTCYSYRVKAYKKYNSVYYWSSAGTSASGTLMAVPKVTVSKGSEKNQFVIKWKKVSGAVKYVIYRRSSKEGWKKIAVVGNVKTYTDTVSNTKINYAYAVRAYNGTELSAYNVVYAPNPSGADVLAAGKYYICSALSTAYVMQAKDASAKNGAYIVINTSEAASYQQYNLSYDADGYAVITNASSGRALTASGNYVIQKKYSGAAEQKWIVELNYDSTYYIRSAVNNKVMTVKDSSCSDDTSIVLTTASAIKAQKFYLPTKMTKAKSAKSLMTAKIQNLSSDTNWLIAVNCTTNRFGVYYGSKGNWTLKYYWLCTTGNGDNKTVKGEFEINGNRGYSFSGHNEYTCYWYSSFYGSYLIHSTLYKIGTMEPLDSRLGMDLSQGCVRLYIDNAKWVYYNIPIGTKVYTY